MALDETQRRTLYEGDGTVTQFAFSFVVFQTSDIAVYSSTDGGDTEVQLSFEQDYTVVLNADQDNSPGGTVRLLRRQRLEHASLLHRRFLKLSQWYLLHTTALILGCLTNQLTMPLP